MDDFSWDDLGFSEWNTPVTDSNWDLNSDINWSDYGVDFGGDYGGGGNYGGDFNPGTWGAGSINWGSEMEPSWGNTNDGGAAWFSGEGTGTSMNGGGGYTAGQGQFGQGQFNMNTMAGSEWDAPASGNAGVTGAMGGFKDEKEPGWNSDPLLNGTAAAAESPAVTEDGKGPLGAVRDGFKSVREFGKENADLMRLGIGLAGVYAARQDSQRSDKLMEQQMADRQRENAMKEELYRQQLANMRAAQGHAGGAMASQASAASRNNANADYWNRQSRTSADEARSLYNPQELGVRGYAQEAASTGRSVQDIRDRMARQGKSQGSIDAEVRRAKVAGSANATTGYMKGLDAGRSAQTGALSSAKGLSSSYGGYNAPSIPSVSVPSFGSNSGAIDYYNDQASGNSNAIQDLLNYYLGNPLGTSNDNAVKKRTAQ